MNDATLLFAWGQVTSEEWVIEVSIKKKAGDLHFKDSTPLLSPERRVEVPSWAVTVAGLREVALVTSKQLLHYNCAHTIGSSGCPGWTFDFRQAAQCSPV